MRSSQNRILTTHTGSLPRPAALTAMYAGRIEGEAIDEAALDRAGLEATRHVVRAQLDAGIDIGNNGEQQREAFFLYVRRRMSGFGGSWIRRTMADVAKYPGYRAWAAEQDGARKSVSNRGALPKAIGPVEYLDPALVQAECDTFTATLAEMKPGFIEPFMTAPSPGIVAAALQNEYYDTEDAYLAALGRALRIEYEAIHKAGFLLQIDAPDLALERHVSFQDRPLSDFIDFAEKVVATINDALANIPRERVRIHACWGNYEAPHDCDVDLHDILPTISRAKVGGWVLPFANPRHAHEYRCLDKLPLDDGQVVVAGVIDPLTNFVEHPEVVADRLERVAQVVGDPSRVIAGTDCGFDTSAGRGRVAEDVVWAKLRAMADGARIASERLGMKG
ncbi:MAG TPA: cobalamin-independent methionine synthase II family protein [Rhodopila sp.]|uniref:cobalamin-independent methionine synthase II family protein n=1 Tax=Rhodopila sp. TaxID=2480087 RepID=UPI002C3A3D29|nr:cobalamin-independent methionine synthase II family protein [Rhodopila sp.]HVY17089.1 cobalamin-independent methionine synthase II family protein [Rhodopila sp.]